MKNPLIRFINKIAGFALLAFLPAQPVCSLPVAIRDTLHPESISETRVGLEELEITLKPSSISPKTAFGLLSEIVLKPVNFDWRKMNIQSLKGLSLGLTNSSGRFDFYPMPRFAFAWPALGLGDAGWEGVIDRVGVKSNFLELTVRFQKGGESFSRVFQVGKTTREIYGLGKLKGQTRTVLDLDPEPGVRFLRDIISDPTAFRWKMITGNLPDLGGARLGQTNTSGRIDIGLSQRMIYPWTVLGRSEEGWDAVIMSQKTVGEILEFTVRLTKGSRKVFRTFQIHPNFIQDRLPSDKKDSKQTAPRRVLEIGDSLGTKAVSSLILRGPNFDWAEEAGKFPNLVGLRLGETNSRGNIDFSPIPNFMFHWGVLGFHQKGWQAVITGSGVRQGRYDLTVRLSKGGHSVVRMFQIGHFTRILSGQ